MATKRLNVQIRSYLGLAVPLVLLLAPAVVSASAGKFACPYENRLCQWTARYLFGGTVIGDMAFFDGGILSNDATTPANGSAFEVIDLRTMSPLIVQFEANETLKTSRYRHQLVVWKDKILAVGGQHDDANGASQKVINVIELDLHTRQWALRKQFKQPGGTVDIIIETSVVADDQLLVVFVALDPSASTRSFLSLDLITGYVGYNFNLANGASQVLDWPLVGTMTLGKNGDFPHLVVQSKRQLPKVDHAITVWFEVTGEGDTGVEGPLPFSASTPFKKLAGGNGGKVLTLKVLRILGKPRMVTWTVTTATFTGGRQESVNAVSMYNIDVGGPTGKRSVTLQLSKVCLALSFNISDFQGLLSVDLPLHGNLAVTAADVTALPYVGQVDLIGELDAGNVNILEWPGKGFVIRGSSLADSQCQRTAYWQPFVLTVDLTATMSTASTANPVIKAVSNHTWCSTRHAQLIASEIVGDANALESNAKLYAIGSGEGAALVVLNMQLFSNPGAQLVFPDNKASLRGAFISIVHSTVHNFSIPAFKGFSFSQGYASCLTNLAGTPVYLQTGGQYFDQKGVQRVDSGFVAVPLQLGKQVQPMVQVGGASSAQGAIFPALACSPDGIVYTFGGLVIEGYKQVKYGGVNLVLSIVNDANRDTIYPVKVWAASNSLTTAKLSGSLSAPTLSKPQQLGLAANRSLHYLNIPSPRNGHILTYLPPATVESLGLSKGALLLYGGSNVTEPSLSSQLTSVTETSQLLGNTFFDRSVWLFDLEVSKWIKLAADGLSDAPPGLMYHSAVLHKKEVMIWGGLRFVPQSKTLKISTDLYVLDFGQPTPRWRKAPVDNINVQGDYQLGFPNTGIAPLPESGAVALMHKAGISLTAIPQSVQPSVHAWLANWGYETLNLTAGDWVRLEVPKDKGLRLEKPLLLNSAMNGVLLTAAEPAGLVGRSPLGAPSKQQNDARPVLQCGKNATTALMLRASEAVVEGLTITGCNGSGIIVAAYSTGYSPAAILRNLHIVYNTGKEGAAVHLGRNAAVVLKDCIVSHNKAVVSIIRAEAGAQVVLVNTNVTHNNGSGVASVGSNVTIKGCRFSHNTAGTQASASSSPAVPSAVLGAALSVMCDMPSYHTRRCQSNVYIVNSTFSENMAESMGGALYLGAGTFAMLENSNFSGHVAAEGGAILADRGSCLAMTAVHFKDNKATKRGGAVMMRGSSCMEVVWHKATFFNNTASTQGGAMYLSEMINMNITGQGAFNNNTAGEVPAAGDVWPASDVWSPTILGYGGGALYLGLWNSYVTIYNTSFVGNNATGSGGAVEILSIDSFVQVINTTAVGNYAGPAPLDSPHAYGQAATSEGGVVHMQGPTGRLQLSHVDMTANGAGRGGAVSVTTGQGGFTSVNSSFSGNTALIAGGAVAVTERKAAAISSTTFEHNRLLWPHIAAGGGFYCYLCERVSIKDSYFGGNMATFGGGAAVLQPSGASSIVHTAFVENTALPLNFPPRNMTVIDEAQRRRSLLSAGFGQYFTAAQIASEMPWLMLCNVSTDFLGPLENTTGDPAFYSGSGGGLYISVKSTVDINGSCFSSNHALNGGGLFASTGSCQAFNSGRYPCQLRLSGTSILNSNMAAGAGYGDGLLITKVDPSWVDLADCSAGNALNLSTIAACLQQPSKLCEPQSSPPADMASASSYSVGTLDPEGYLATSAAIMTCSRTVDPTGTPMWIPENCSETVQAAPGGLIGVAVQLFDWLARPVMDGTDAQMPLEVGVLNSDGTQPNVLVTGNRSQAVDGIGYFPNLKVSGRPGDRYQLVFRTSNGLSLTRKLVLRECQAGEHNSIQQVMVGESYTCEACGSPQYSFYPQAQTCGQCPSLNSLNGYSLNSYSHCSAAVVVPANGMYQSHPRSPLLHRCITAAACSRSTDTQVWMADWAAEHAGMTITQLNGVNTTGHPYYQPYMQQMCASGYTGPLCGACSAGYGHSGYRCAKCMNSSANSFCYFIVCMFMFLVPALQTLLHSKNVQKRHQQHLHTAGLGAGLGSARSISLNLGPQVSLQESLKPCVTAEQELGGIEQLQWDKDVELTAIRPNGQQPSGHDEDMGLDTAAAGDQNQSHVVLSLTPYISGVVPATAADHAPDGSVNNSSSGCDQPEDFQRMRAGATVAIDAADAAPVVLGPSSMQQHQQPKQVPAADAEPRQQTGLLNAIFSTRPLHRADTVVKRSASAASPLSSTGVLGQPAGLKPVGPAAAAAAAATSATGIPHLRFYHTDMLVSYMQLLGLLRLIRLDWSQWLKPVQSTLTYLDFTSGVSTWVSIECSFSDTGLLPKSLKRSLVLLMWPLAALLFLASIWLSGAYIATRRRGPTHRVMSQIRRLVPHMVLSALTIVYFLYTPTSREIITLFSCEPVDTVEALQRVAPQYSSTPDAVDALMAFTLATAMWQGVWMSDTAVPCSSPAHMGIALGLGMPGLVLWVFGVPIALWLVLKRNSKCNVQGISKLEDPRVELMFGVFYEKYRYKRYYWECVVLLQNCTLTMLLVLLQSQPATLQVLVAMTVIFIGIVLQVSFKPYAVQLLDTLRQLAMYALLATLFCMMLVSLTELQQTPGLPLAALIIIFILNLGVVLLHVWAIYSELSRWIVYEQLTWGNIGQRFRAALQRACGGKLAGIVNNWHRPPASSHSPGLGPV